MSVEEDVLEAFEYEPEHEESEPEYDSNYPHSECEIYGHDFERVTEFTKECTRCGAETSTDVW